MIHSQAQIIATLGPSIRSLNHLRVLMEHGMDAVRLNFAHGTIEEHRHAIHNVRIASSEHNRTIPIIAELPGARVETGPSHTYDAGVLSPITDWDGEIISFCNEQEIDYISIPFTASARDVNDVRLLLWEESTHMRIIARIERVEALRYLREIIQETDAVMIARKHLAQEIPVEQIPYIEYRITKEANWAHKPAIVATEMLSSMMGNPEPTRAEVSDIAYTIINGADAILLNEETAIGGYPVEAVHMVEKIILEAERHIPERAINRL